MREIDDSSIMSSQTDLMSGALFVFIIGLVAYVINFSGNQIEHRSVGQHLSEIVLKQSQIVGDVSYALNRYGIAHEANKSAGVIRISSDELAFAPGAYDLSARQEERLKVLGRVLAGTATCYTNIPEGSYSSLGCSADQSGQIRSVSVEGHTDNVPSSGRGGVKDNLALSSLRAATIVRLLKENSVISSWENSEGRQPVYAAGFGDSRPVNEHNEPVSDNENRRIEIRFHLETPFAS